MSGKRLFTRPVPDIPQLEKTLIILSNNYHLKEQTLAEASQAPDTNVRISGDNESDMTSPVWPVNDVHC